MPRHLASLPLPPYLWLPSSGPLQVLERKLKPLQSQVVQAGITLNTVSATSAMHGCCASNLNPWAVPSELTGGFAGATQQQGATGLRVHQQFEQGLGCVMSQLNWPT